MTRFEEFARKYGRYAENVEKRFGIAAEIVLSVAAHETGFGRSQSSQIDNNFFGISASSFFDPMYWNGRDKRRTNDTAGFYRVYSNAQNSFYDFGWLLSNASRYSTVRNGFQNPTAFVAAFINSGYFTGNKMVYGNALLDYIPNFEPLVNKGFDLKYLAYAVGFFILIKR